VPLGGAEWRKAVAAQVSTRWGSLLLDYDPSVLWSRTFLMERAGFAKWGFLVTSLLSTIRAVSVSWSSEPPDFEGGRFVIKFLLDNPSIIAIFS
jgi:hypothetical protein